MSISFHRYFHNKKGECQRIHLARIAKQFLLVFHYISSNFLAHKKGECQRIHLARIAKQFLLVFHYISSNFLAHKKGECQCIHLARIAKQFLLVFHYISSNFLAHKKGQNQHFALAKKCLASSLSITLAAVLILGNIQTAKALEASTIFQTDKTLKNNASTTILAENEAATENEASSENAAVNITAKAAVLIENNSGRILYEKEKDTELIPASITKIMTLLLIFEALEQKKITLEDSVSVSDYAAQMGGSQVFLEAGETQTVNDMIKCISIASANDAAVAMAEYVAGSEANFVKLMNQKANQLGMKHTNFKNCNGLDDTIESGHYSSAYDVALMSKELVSKYPEIEKYSTVWMDEITHKTRKGESKFGLTNTNKLIRIYNGITGLKTGSTSKAKYCLSATAKRNGVSLTAVIMAAPDPKIRFTEAAALLDYGFATCTNYQERPDDIPLKEQKIAGGIKSTVIPRVEKTFSYTLTGQENADNIVRKISYQKNLKAPIKEGQPIGKVIYSLDGKEVGSLPVLSAETIKKATFLDYLSKVLHRFCLSDT